MASTIRSILAIMSMAALLVVQAEQGFGGQPCCPTCAHRLQEEQGSGGGKGKGSQSGSVKGKGGEQHGQQKHEDQGQAGSQGQQGTKAGSPIEKDKVGTDKMIGEKGADVGKGMK